MLLLMALALAAPSPSPAAPSIKLVVWPSGERIWQGKPLYTGARVIVEDTDGSLPCPEIRVDWADGSRSGVKSSDHISCDPYSQPPGRYTFQPALHAYREAGRFTVEACVVNVRGECRRELSAYRLVSIRRADQDPDRKWARR